MNWPSNDKLYRCRQIRECETIAQRQYNISENELMERAGRAAFQQIREWYPQARNIAIYCGGGNNGGDGFVLARLALQKGLGVHVYALKSEKDLPAAAAHAALQANSEGVETLGIQEPLPKKCDLIVDALLGIGIKGSVRQPVADIINKMNAQPIPIVALDIPSGLNADTGQASKPCISAEASIIFIGKKVGMYTADGPDHCGDKIACADLDLKNIVHNVAVPVHSLSQRNITKLPARRKNSHKQDYGQVLVIGGNRGMAGAAALAAKAALRTGAGSVVIATLPDHVSAILPLCPEAMIYPIQNAKALRTLLAKATVSILGPGLGEDEWAQALFRTVVDVDMPQVVDASALRLLAGQPDKNRQRVLTPHPGEAAALLAGNGDGIQADRFKAVEDLQKKYQSTVVLKGKGSIVKTSDGSDYVVNAGNPGMASAGMGDVLSGVIGGLIAQQLSLDEAAKTGSWIHAHAGDLALDVMGERGMLASDLLSVLPRILTELSA